MKVISVALCYNSRLNEDEKRVKEMKVLENAANELSKYWSGVSFDGFPVRPMPVPCTGRSDTFPSSDDVVQFLESPLRDLTSGQHSDAFEEFRFLVNHADRRHNEITFSKCQFFRDDICDHCANHPVQSKESPEFLKKSKGGLFEPIYIYAIQEY